MAECWGARRCEARGPALSAELLSEYADCFRDVLRDRESLHSQAVFACAEVAVWAALSTRLPMLHEHALGCLAAAHVAVLAIVKIFFRHLLDTWFSLENPALEAAYSRVRETYLSHEGRRKVLIAEPLKG